MYMGILLHMDINCKSNASEQSNKIGEERTTALAGQVSSPSPIAVSTAYREHPVMVILNHNREVAVQSSYGGK